jgi:type II restriction enzyme
MPREYKMTFEDVKAYYEKMKVKHGADAYKHVQEIFEGLRAKFVRDYPKRPDVQKKILAGKKIDAEQAWKSFKGNNFERLILHVIEDKVKELGLVCIQGDQLDKKNLTKDESLLRRSIVVHYGEFDITPDMDILIYNPENNVPICIISCKVTLRERIAQTAYWSLKLKSDEVTKNIKAFFVTTDEDGDLVRRPTIGGDGRGFKGRLIAEHDTDGTYVLRDIEQSDKVKRFDLFMQDLQHLFRTE